MNDFKFASILYVPFYFSICFYEMIRMLNLASDSFIWQVVAYC